MVNKPTSPTAEDLMYELINSLHLTEWQRKRLVWRVKLGMWKYKKDKRKYEKSQKKNKN